MHRPRPVHLVAILALFPLLAGPSLAAKPVTSMEPLTCSNLTHASADPADFLEAKAPRFEVDLGQDPVPTSEPACSASIYCPYYGTYLSCVGYEWCHSSTCFVYCDSQMIGCPYCIEP